MVRNYSFFKVKIISNRDRLIFVNIQLAVKMESRKNLFWILCGLVILGALAGLGLPILGIFETPDRDRISVGPPPPPPPPEPGETVPLENNFTLEDIGTAIAISPQGNILASVSNDRKINIWNLETGRKEREFQHREGISATSIAISQDERTLAVGWLGDDAIDVWYLENNQEEPSQILPGNNYNPTSIALNPEGNTLVRGNSNGTIQVWNLTEEKLKYAEISGHQEGELSNRVTSLAISPNGQTFASGSNDGKIKIWNLETGKPLYSNLQEHSGQVTSLTISPNGQTLIGSSSDKTITIWNLNSGEPKKTVAGHLSEIASVATSKNGQLLASGSNDGIVKIWNLNTGDLLKTYQLSDYLDESINLIISSNGQTIVIGHVLQTIKIWRIPKLDDNKQLSSKFSISTYNDET